MSALTGACNVPHGEAVSSNCGLRYATLIAEQVIWMAGMQLCDGWK